MTRARDLANLIGSGNYSSTTFTATAGQTAFTISHTQGFVQVFMNGLLLDETVDYTSNGTAITLTSGAAAGDEIEVVKYNTFSVGDAQTQAQADTRYVNTTGDTMSGDLIVNSNAGIGSSSPSTNNGSVSRIVEIRGTNNNVINGTTDTGGMNGLIIEASHSARSPQPRYAQVGMGVDASGNGTMTFFTAAAAGYVTEKMKIDPSGRVTMPAQPGFSYLGSKSYVIGGTGTQVMSSSNVWASNVNHGHNRGSHFNPSTGRFTCPIAGRYLFTFKCQASDFGSGYLWFYMRLNQSTFSYSQKSQENSWTCQHLGGILELNANDYVDVAWTNNYVSGQIHMPEFTGQLIG